MNDTKPKQYAFDSRYLAYTWSAIPGDWMDLVHDRSVGARSSLKHAPWARRHVEQLVGMGMTTEEIAHEFRVAPNTITSWKHAWGMTRSYTRRTARLQTKEPSE